MKYLPFENISYSSQLDPEEILKRINEIIEPKKTFRMAGFFGNNKHKPYEGNTNGMAFNITRIIGYRNSFLPRIEGLIEKDFQGTKIGIKMRLHSFVMVFMFIWLGAVGLTCLACLTALLNNKDFEPLTLIPFGMLIFGYGLLTAGFKYESLKSKKYLAQLFEAEIEK